jgi:mannose-1-phosphate guanylyltransferase/mannose-6-phosphate isomerase
MTLPTYIQPVILCGDSGTRLWPLSRAGFPKHHGYKVMDYHE